MTKPLDATKGEAMLHPVTVPYIEPILAELRRAPPPVGAPVFLHLGEFGERATRTPVREDEFRAAQLQLTETVLDVAQIGPGHDVLEVGCGFGGNLAVLDARLEGASLVGVDVGPQQLAFARAQVRGRGTNRITWLEGDAVALPVQDASFDRVLAIECAFHFPSRRAFIHEAARAVRPAGRIVLTDLVATPEGREEAASGRLPRGLDRALLQDLAPFPDPWCEEGSWDELAQDAGLSIDVVSDKTASALPSFGFIFSTKPADFVHGPHASDRGAAALLWLLERSFFQLHLIALKRPP